MLRSAAFSAARGRDAACASSSASPNAWKRANRRRATAIAMAKTKKNEDSPGDNVADDEKRRRRQAAATTSPSVSRRAALALSLASTAASLLLEDKPAFAAASAATAIATDPSAADPFADGGTVTLLKVKGDGRDRLSLSEAVVLDTNRKVHSANGAPDDFPGFVRVGFDIKVVVPAEEDDEEEAGSGSGSGSGSGGGEEQQQQQQQQEGENAAAAAAAAETSPSTSAPEAAATTTAAATAAADAPPTSSNGPKRGYQITPEGLIYKDYEIGEGPLPTEGQEVVFDYTAFNESGGRIDSSYLKGRPASARIGVGAGGGLIPGFELGLKGMRAGGRRRLIVPPALGPPVGPQTFFSAKQCEVFDVQLRSVKSCRRRQVAMFSDVVCE